MELYKMKKLKVLDLFSGLGGFSLGLERTGKYKTVAFCEIDKYCTLLLQKHWKGVKIYNDVKKITKENFKTDGIETPDIITGGFPCQPFSVAGKQKGTSDDRHLWPEMFRIIKAFKPRFVIGENVRGIVNIQDGVVFETVCTDLESEGYEVQPFNIPAASVGAPHRRERIWIIATLADSVSNDERREISRSYEEEKRIQEEHRQNNSPTGKSSRTSEIRNGDNGYENMENSRRTLQQGTELREKNEDEVGKENANQHQRSSSSSESNVANAYTRLSNGSFEEVQSGRNTSNTSSEGTTDVANTERKGLEGLNQQSTTISGKDERTYTRNESSRDQATGTTDVANTESSIGHDFYSIARNGEPSLQEIFGDGSSLPRESSWWNVEPNVGRVAYGIPGRVHRLKGLGNSIIPQIAEEIGKAIIKAKEVDEV